MAKRELLWVEDDASMLSGLVRPLLIFGFEITVAANAEEALRMIKTKNFDLYLIDLIIPSGKDSPEEFNLEMFQGIRVIKVIREKSNAPIIVLSVAARDSGIIEELQTLGVNGILSKGRILPSELKEIVEKAVEGKIGKENHNKENHNLIVFFPMLIQFSIGFNYSLIDLGVLKEKIYIELIIKFLIFISNSILIFLFYNFYLKYKKPKLIWRYFDKFNRIILEREIDSVLIKDNAVEYRKMLVKNALAKIKSTQPSQKKTGLLQIYQFAKDPDFHNCRIIIFNNLLDYIDNESDSVFKNSILDAICYYRSIIRQDS